MVATAASTIHFFTGNNIGPRGDLASRCLNIRLAVDRPDPENREFEHPDPVGWTDAHRADILRALYTILLGNPVFGKRGGAKAKTRFKTWWRLIGAAVEHGAKLIGQQLDFQELFMSQEEADEETASLADALTVMRRRWPTFKANDVADLINRKDADAGLDLNDPARNERGQHHAAGFPVRTRPSRLRGDAESRGQAAAGPYRRARESRQSNPASAPIHGSRQR